MLGQDSVFQLSRGVHGALEEVSLLASVGNSSQNTQREREGTQRGRFPGWGREKPWETLEPGHSDGHSLAALTSSLLASDGALQGTPPAGHGTKECLAACTATLGSPCKCSLLNLGSAREAESQRVFLRTAWAAAGPWGLPGACSPFPGHWPQADFLVAPAGSGTVPGLASQGRAPCVCPAPRRAPQRGGQSHFPARKPGGAHPLSGRRRSLPTSPCTTLCSGLTDLTASCLWAPAAPHPRRPLLFRVPAQAPSSLWRGHPARCHAPWLVPGLACAHVECWVSEAGPSCPL